MRKHALVGSLTIHASALLLLLLLGAIARNSIPPPPAVILFGPPLRAPRPPEVHVEGGGGQQSPLPARRGRAPLPVKRRVFLPPMVAVNEHSELAAPEALIGPPDLGLSAGAFDFGGGGPGIRGGYGGGENGGFGAGDGPRLGGPPGPSRAKITRHPLLLHKEEPEYSEDARKAHFQGTVVLMIDVGLDGHPANIRVVQGVGLGLDERAIDAVSHWRFRPAVAGDRPVVAPALVEVGFHLL